MFFDTPSFRSENGGSSVGRGRIGADLQPLVEAERYWRKIGKNGQPPRRSDLDPRQLGFALPATMILERVAPGIARVRLAGQGLNQLFGMDLRGMPASILVSPSNREALGAQVEAMFAGPAIVEIPLHFPRSWGRRPVAGRLLLLPLTDDSGQVNRALGVLAAREELPTGGQQRFEIDAQGAFRCTLIPRPHKVRPTRRRTDTAPAPAPVRQRNVDPSPIPTREASSMARPGHRIKPFTLIEGGVVRANTTDEPRPQLKLVVSND